MEKKDLKEFESEMNVNSEFFGLFRNELLNNLESSKKRSKNRIRNKSRIETTTLIHTNLSSSDDSENQVKPVKPVKPVKSVNQVNQVKPVNQVNSVNQTKSMSKIDTPKIDSTKKDEIGLTEYELEKLIQIINYFVNINQ